jgi:CRP/FNR family transcriptional regulator
MRGKLASALCYLSSQEFLYEKIFESLTRPDIADFAGITQESAVKFLKEFEREKLLKLEGKDIVIKDRTKLQLISKTG